MKFRRKLKSKSEVPIVGYRVWRRESGYLASITQTFHWPLRKPMVRDVFNDMGIHAVKTIQSALELARAYSVDVVGSVYLWMPEDGDPIEVMKLEENYGVPVEMRSEIRNTKIPLMPAAVFQTGNLAEIGRLLAQAGAMPMLVSTSAVNPYAQGMCPMPQGTLTAPIDYSKFKNFIF